jgi:hypothetical protein
MISIPLEQKCNILKCNNQYEFIENNIKYCIEHHPNLKILKYKCRYCDIDNTSNYTCNDCKNPIENERLTNPNNDTCYDEIDNTKFELLNKPSSTNYKLTERDKNINRINQLNQSSKRFYLKNHNFVQKYLYKR